MIGAYLHPRISLVSSKQTDSRRFLAFSPPFPYILNSSSKPFLCLSSRQWFRHSTVLSRREENIDRINEIIDQESSMESIWRGCGESIGGGKGNSR